MSPSAVGPWTKYAQQQPAEGPWTKYQSQQPAKTPDVTSVEKAAPKPTLTGGYNPNAQQYGPIVRALDAAGGAVLGAPTAAAHVIENPLSATTGAYQNIKDWFDPKTRPTWEGIKSVLPEAIGGGIGNVAVGEGASAIPAGKIAGPIVEPIREAAREDPDVAAQRGLRPPAKQAIRTQQNLAGARPFLQGAQNLEDLQSRIPRAKQEIWNPYNKAIDAIGERPVKGPDGMTTVRELEAERLKASAERQQLKKLNPSDQQAALQKEGSLKANEDRYKSILDSLDPELQTQGIDPAQIRATHGNVQGLSKLVEGRNTLTEADRPYGFGRMTKIDLKNPSSILGEPLQGVKDLVAGRPLWSGKPTDVAVREGFRSGGEKPNFSIAPPNFAYRTHTIGEPGIDLSKPGHASMSAEEAAQYIPHRNGGVNQVMSRINIGKMNPQDYEMHTRPEGAPWVRFKRQLTDADYQ